MYLSKLNSIQKKKLEGSGFFSYVAEQVFSHQKKPKNLKIRKKINKNGVK